MTLDELQQLVDKDLKLDDTELDSESARIPLLHNKYLQHFNKFSLLQKRHNKSITHLKEKSGNTIQVKQMNLYIKKNHLT